MNPDNPLRDPDELSGDLLDSVGQEQIVAQPTDGKRLADLLFLDSLLQRIHRPDREANDARLSKLLAGLNTEPQSAAITEADRSGAAQSVRRKAIRRTWLALAAPLAAAVLVFLVVVGLGPQQTAQAALQRAIASANEAVDRQYSVTITLASKAQPSAMLYVHGGSRFAVRHTGPFGREHWLGFDGHEAWFAAAAGPVLVSDDMPELKARLRDADVDMPFLQITTVLKRLADDYDLQLVRDKVLRVQGMKKSDRPMLPDEIEFTSDRESGTVQRMVVRWTSEQPAVREIAFTLKSEEQMPDAWYGHAAHHVEGRRVVRLP